MAELQTGATDCAYPEQVYFGFYPIDQRDAVNGMQSIFPHHNQPAALS